MGTLFALGAACGFGISTPFAKYFLQTVDPWMLVGLMYMGGSIGLTPIYLLCNGFRWSPTSFRRGDERWLLGNLLAGGIAAPFLLMMGLQHTSAAVASLLLNFESVFTALVAWTIFRERWQRQVLMGICLITTGGILISHSSQTGMGFSWGALAILGTALAWGIDSNFTVKIAHRDPLQIAIFKSGSAGLWNIAIATLVGQSLPPLIIIIQVCSMGFISYGLTYYCFSMALRHIGASRAGAFFALSPLVGVTLAVFFLGEPFTVVIAIAAILMSLGATFCAWEPN
ncbi:MAG: DMT family transporter [Thermosynechococcaceae cyanobacterium]